MKKEDMKLSIIRAWVGNDSKPCRITTAHELRPNETVVDLAERLLLTDDGRFDRDLDPWPAGVIEIRVILPLGW